MPCFIIVSGSAAAVDASQDGGLNSHCGGLSGFSGAASSVPVGSKRGRLIANGRHSISVILVTFYVNGGSCFVNSRSCFLAVRLNLCAKTNAWLCVLSLVFYPSAGYRLTRSRHSNDIKIKSYQVTS